MNHDFVILVDENDNETGVMEKMEAHVSGSLHRALSVFIFNSQGKWLLHKRAANKYHSAGLWTNACCSHPRHGESTIDAANRRLLEEMGMSCALEHQFSFTYKASLDHGLTEHELDHVFIGYSDTLPVPDPAEVAEWKYVTLEELEAELKYSAADYTEWFKLIYPRLISEMATHD